MQMREPQVQETQLQKAQRLAAEAEAVEKAQKRAGSETDRLFRLYGSTRSYFAGGR